MNKIIFDKIQNRLNDKGIHYSVDTDIISLDMRISDTVGVVNIIYDVLDKGIISYATFNSKSPQEKRASIAEYLHRANYGLPYGNFEMDYSDGEIRFKLASFFDNNSAVSNTLIDRHIYIPCFMFERYGEGLLKLLIGEGNPESLINDAEQMS